MVDGGLQVCQCLAPACFEHKENALIEILQSHGGRELLMGSKYFHLTQRERTRTSSYNRRLSPPTLLNIVCSNSQGLLKTQAEVLPCHFSPFKWKGKRVNTGRLCTI